MTWPAGAGRVSWRGSRNVRSTSIAHVRQASPADSQPTSLTPQSSTPRSSYASLCEDPAELEVLHELVRRRQSIQSTTEDGEVAAREEEVAARRRRGRWGSTSSGKEQKHTGAGQAAGAGQSVSKVDAVSAKSIMKKEKSEKPSILDDFQRLKSEFQVAKAHLQTVLDEPATPSPQKFCGNIDELWEPETQPDPYPQETPEDAHDVTVDLLTDTFGKQRQRREPRKSERLNVAGSGEHADRIKQDLELVEQQLAAAKSQADRIQQQRQALLERARLEQCEEPQGAEVGFSASFPEASSASWAGLESEPSCTEYGQDCVSAIQDQNEYVYAEQAWMQADAELNAAALQIQAVYRGYRARKEVNAKRARLGDSWVKVQVAEARIDEMLQLFGTESPVHVNGLASIADAPEAAALNLQAAPQPCSPLQQATTAGPAPKRKLSSKRAGLAERSSTTPRTQSTGKKSLQADNAERRLPNSRVGSKRASKESCSAEPSKVACGTPPATPRGNAEVEHEVEIKLQDNKRKSSAQELLAGGTHVYPRARKFAAATSSTATASKQQEGTQERSSSIIYPRARRSSAAANASPHARKASTGSQGESSKLAEIQDELENAVPKATPKRRVHKTLSKSSSAPISSMPAGTQSTAPETLSSTKSKASAPTHAQQTTETDTSNLEDSSMLTPRSRPQPHPYPAYRASFRDLKSYLPAPPDSSAARTAPAPEPPPAPTRTPPRNSSASRTPPRNASQGGPKRSAPSTATNPRGSNRSSSRVKIKPPASPERPDEPPPPPWSSRHAMASSDEDVQTADVRDGGRIPQGVPARAAHVKADPSKALGGRSASWRTAESLKCRERSTAHMRQAKLPSSESEASSDEELAFRRQQVKKSSKIFGAKPSQRRLENVPSSKSEPVRAESVSSTTVSESETVPLPAHHKKNRASNLSDPPKAHVESRRDSNRSGHPKAAVPQHHRASNSSGIAKDSAESSHRRSSSQPQRVTAESRRESNIPHPSRGSSRTSRPPTAAKPRTSGLPPPSAEEMVLAGAGLPDGQVYMGFRNKDGGREGFGVMRSKDGQIYTGQWQSGKRNGQGTLFFDGGVFEGQWVDNSAHGTGMISHKNGDIFKGEYKDNKKCGPGTYTWKDGSEETGDYLDGQRHGWHHMKRDGEDWDIYYERGNMVSANKRGSAAEAVLDPKRHASQSSC